MSAQQNSLSSENTSWRFAAGAVAALLSFIFSLAVSRILFEGLFPRGLWLGRPLAAMILGFLAAGLGLILWQILRNKLSQDDPAENTRTPNGEASLSPTTAAWTATAIFFPLALNLVYLLNRTTNLATSRFLFFTALWLMVLFLARLLVRPAVWRWLGFFLLVLFLLPVYLATLGQTVGTADTFEFQVVVPKLGIVHPTGYPLYLLISKPFTLLPLNSVAWRVNLATAVYGLAAVCLLYLLAWRLTKWPLPSLIAAAIFGLSATFWSQAVEAEVYTLHALIVVVALLLMREIGNWRLEANLSSSDQDSAGSDPESGDSGQGTLDGEQKEKVGDWGSNNAYAFTVLLAFALGLGLTNHLTTVLLLPAAALTLFFAFRAGRYKMVSIRRPLAILLLALAFLVPLLLYAYLPIRWAAVNGEPMGYSRFVDWVIGGRFQGALQLSAWLEDSTRYDIVGRFFADEWASFWTLLLIFVGGAYLLLWQWRYGLILLITWLGYVFYALSYYVPDVSVFIIPAQMIFTIWWLVGIVAALDLVGTRPGTRRYTLVGIIFVMLGIIPLIVSAANQTLPIVNRSGNDSRTGSAQAVLNLPIEHGGAILADSDKYPALYYLQQAEGYRPDLDILVLPDEAAYRSELDMRLAVGQDVYMARFLPGLEGIYHLNSQGPLTRVSREPASELPPGAETSDLNFGPIRLIGYTVVPNSPFTVGESAVTLYWQADETVDEVWHVYTRWSSENIESSINGQHPANNTNPTIAWQPGEIVADFHTLPQPVDNGLAELQVALAPPFTRPADLAWQNVVEVSVEGATLPSQEQLIRKQIGPVLLNGATFPTQIRPGAPYLVQLSGYAPAPDQLSIALAPKDTIRDAELPGLDWQAVNPLLALQSSDALSSDSGARYLWPASMSSDLAAGDYELLIAYPGSASTCGWLAARSDNCVLGQIEISGAPVAEDATNFDDLISLLAIDVPDTELQPGGKLSVNLTWQALSTFGEDYTVFVQVLDWEDRIVGQVDSWPVQGTYPTSQWEPAEIVEDPYLVQLSDDLPPGTYKLHVGLYLLETLRRLPVVDDNGAAVDDKDVFPGLEVP